MSFHPPSLFSGQISLPVSKQRVFWPWAIAIRHKMLSSSISRLELISLLYFASGARTWAIAETRSAIRNLAMQSAEAERIVD